MASKGKQREDATELSRAVNQVLLARIKALGLDNKTVAEKAEITAPTVTRIFKHGRVLDINEFVALCRALGLTPWRVLRQAEEAVHATTADPAATYIAAAEAKLQAVLQSDVTPAARRHEPDPYEGIGEENQDLEEN